MDFNEETKVIPPPRKIMPIGSLKNIKYCIELVYKDVFNGYLCVIDDDIDGLKYPLNHMPKCIGILNSMISHIRKNLKWHIS